MLDKLQCDIPAPNSDSPTTEPRTEPLWMDGRAPSAHLAAVMFQYPERAFFVIGKRNPLRRYCTIVSHSPRFEHVILLCIFLNCITLGMSSNRLGFAHTGLGRTLQYLEYVWVAVFAIEALLKIVAMGFLMHPGSYLRDGWNLIDFIVVIMGFVDLFTAGNLTALRTVRVLRPLRAITRIRGMRVLVSTMIGSLPMLIDVLILCAFTFFIFGLVAVQLFAGSLRYRCAAPNFGSAFTLPNAIGRLINVSYSVVNDDTACSGPMTADVVWYDDGGLQVARHGALGAGFVCPSGTYCTFAGNPNYGMTSFDNILWAWLTIFQCITQESWTDVLFYTSDAVTWWVWPFFVTLVVFGSFYMVNLALAVLFVQFNTDNHMDEQGNDPESRPATAGFAPGSRNLLRTEEGGGSDNDSEDASETGGLRKQLNLVQVAGTRRFHSTFLHTSLSPSEVAAMHTFRRALYEVAASKRLEYLTAGLIIVNTVVMCVNWYCMPASVENYMNYINYALTIYFLIELLIKLTAFGFKKYFSDGMNIFDALVVAISMTELLLDIIPAVSGVGPLSVLRAFRLLRIFRLARSWRELHMIIHAMFKSISSTFYLLLLMLLFMFIAALMGMQLFGYKFTFCDYVEGASPICPLGMRVWGDCPNHFHCFLPCTADDYGTWVPASGSRFGGHAFCERFCASSVAGVAADATASAVAVPANGGCEYLAMVGKSDVPRAQFDNLFWGLYSLFQLLTTENWNNIMYDGMRTTTPWAALYFVAVLIIGTYLVFNLFIAILLDNFSGTFADSTQSEEASVGAGRLAVLPMSPSNSSSDGSARTDITEYSTGPGGGNAEDYNSSGFMHPLRVSTTGFASAPALIMSQQPMEGHTEGPHRGSTVVGVRWAEAGYPSLGPERAASHPGQADGAWDAFQPVRSPAAQPAVDSLVNNCDLSRLKSQGRKIVPIDDKGRPATAEHWSATEPLHPVILADKLGAGNAEHATTGSATVDKYAASSRRATFAAADVEGESGGTASPQRSLKRTASSTKSITGVTHSEHLAKHIKGISLLIFAPDTWVRWRAACLVHHSYFEQAVLYLIVASSITLALDTPSLDADSRLAMSIRIMDYIFTGAFALEALLKIITFGFAFTGKHAYIRNGWNVLDFLIVLVGFALIGVQLSGAHADNIQMLRVLRTLRALRPLRAASQYPGLKVVVNALFAVLPAMANVALVCLLFYLIFAILTVNLFKGQLYHCIDTDTGERLDPFYVLPPGRTLTRDWCEANSIFINASMYHTARNIQVPMYAINTGWVNPIANFDNIAIAMLSLFQVATLELWVDIMFTAVDAVGVGKQPLWNHQPLVIVLFIFFVIICCFFVLNLFIGVVLEKFTELQQAQTAASVFVTPQQQVWVDVQKLLLRTSIQLRPARPEHLWQGRLYDVVSSPAIDSFILGVILVNVLCMAMVHVDMSPSWQASMSYSNLAFTFIFLVEALMKILAYGPSSYFRDNWNGFDFFVVVVSVASVILDFSNTKNLSFMPVLRVMRVIRVFRLIRRAKGLQRLLGTLVHSLPALANVGGVLLLFFFIFAVIGMNLFGGIKYGNFINRHTNFNNFPNAMLALMRMITGESWSGIMQGCMDTHDCILVTKTTMSPASNITLLVGSYLDPGDPLLDGVSSNDTRNQCPISAAAAVIFFPLFVVLCGLILLNLIIAVILENMFLLETDEGLPVGKSLIGQFVDAWSNIDHAAGGYIHASKLPLVLAQIDQPMGTKGLGNGRSVTQAVIMSVDIPVHRSNTVTFVETLHALAGRVAGTELPEIEEEWLMERFGRRLPGGGTTFPKYTAAHFHAALYVQAAVRGFMARHKMRGMMQTFAGKPGASDIGLKG